MAIHGDQIRLPPAKDRDGVCMQSSHSVTRSTDWKQYAVKEDRPQPLPLSPSVPFCLGLASRSLDPDVCSTSYRGNKPKEAKREKRGKKPTRYYSLGGSSCSFRAMEHLMAFECSVDRLLASATRPARIHGFYFCERAVMLFHRSFWLSIPRQPRPKYI